MNTFTKIAIGVVATASLVVGAGAYAGKHFSGGMKGDFMIYKLEKELDLSTEQVDNLKNIQSYMKAKHESHDRTAGKAIMVDLLKAPQLDQAKVLTMMDEKMQSMRDQAPEMLGKVAGFTDSLTPEQRTELVEMVEKFSGRMGKHRGE
jgi:Spy/CpxP family protein refolding chaperone